jgi:hypothetical protein
MSLPQVKIVDGVFKIFTSPRGKICTSYSKQELLDLFAIYGFKVPTPQPTKSVLCDILNSRILGGSSRQVVPVKVSSPKVADKTQAIIYASIAKPSSSKYPMSDVNGTFKIFKTSRGKICTSYSKQELVDIFVENSIPVPSLSTTKIEMCRILSQLLGSVYSPGPSQEKSKKAKSISVKILSKTGSLKSLSPKSPIKQSKIIDSLTNEVNILRTIIKSTKSKLPVSLESLPKNSFSPVKYKSEGYNSKKRRSYKKNRSV